MVTNTGMWTVSWEQSHPERKCSAAPCAHSIRTHLNPLASPSPPPVSTLTILGDSTICQVTINCNCLILSYDFYGFYFSLPCILKEKIGRQILRAFLPYCLNYQKKISKIKFFIACLEINKEVFRKVGKSYVRNIPTFYFRNARGRLSELQCLCMTFWATE